MNEFSFSTINNFDDHINKSIRGYSDLILDVISMSKYFLESNSAMVDIGSSTGKMINEIELSNRKSINDIKYIAVENEQNMIDNTISNPNISYFNQDIRHFIFPKNVSLVTSIFTLQFINKSNRLSIVKNIYKSLNVGGAFIFAEKVYSKDAKIQDMLTFMNYDHKREYFSDTEILDKENSLRHMLRPNSIDELIGLESIIQESGFSNIEPFWRNHNFVGYIAIK